MLTSVPPVGTFRTERDEYCIVVPLGGARRSGTRLLLGRSTTTGKQVVVKSLLRKNVANRVLCESFINECRLHSLFCHENIVRYVEHGWTNDEPYLITEKFGARLSQDIASAFSNLPIGPRTYLALDMMRQVLNATVYMNNVSDKEGNPLQCVNLDLGIHNLLTDANLQLRLTDFGSTVTRSFPYARWGEGWTVFSAPELTEQRAITRSAEVHAVGAIAFILWTGRPLHTLDLKTVAIHTPGLGITGDRDPTSRLAVQFWDLLKRAVAISPRDRFPDAASLESAVGAIISEVETDLRTRALDIFGNIAFPYHGFGYGPAPSAHTG